jgi:gluconolactonase
MLEHAARRVTRTGYDVTVLAAQLFQRRRGEIRRSGRFKDADPTYGIGGDHEGHREQSELPRDVDRLDAKSGQMTVPFRTSRPITPDCSPGRRSGER